MLEEPHTEQLLALVQEVMKQQQLGGLPKEFPQQDELKRKEKPEKLMGFYSVSMNQRLYIEVQEKQRGIQH